MRRKLVKKRKPVSGDISVSPCLAFDDCLTNDEEVRPRQIYIFRVVRKWTIPQIAAKLGISEDVVYDEYLAYAKRVVEFHNPRYVENEVEFCEEQIRQLSEVRHLIFNLKPKEQRLYIGEIVALSKAIAQWEEMICKLKGHLLPSSVMQKLVEERQKRLAKLDKLTPDAQQKIFRILRREKILSTSNSLPDRFTGRN